MNLKGIAATAVPAAPVRVIPPVTHVTLTLPVEVAEALVQIGNSTTGPHSFGDQLFVNFPTTQRATEMRNMLNEIGRQILFALKGRDH